MPVLQTSLLCSSGDNVTNLIKSLQTFTRETLGSGALNRAHSCMGIKPFWSPAQV